MADQKPVFDEDVESLIDTSSLDPSQHYRFCHERPQRQARLRSRGYVPVRADDETGVIPLVEGLVGPDGIIRSGDCILMACPIERFQARRTKINTLNRSRMAAPKAQFRQKTQSARPGGKNIRVVEGDSTDRE
jgi:hypothetical protein